MTLTLAYSQLSNCRTLDFSCRLMACDIDRLASRRGSQLVVLDCDLESTEQHLARRHFIDDGVEPVIQQRVMIVVTTSDVDACLCLNQAEIGHHCGQGKRGLLERFGQGVADTTNTDIGLVFKMFPVGVTHQQELNRWSVQTR